MGKHAFDNCERGSKGRIINIGTASPVISGHVYMEFRALLEAAVNELLPDV